MAIIKSTQISRAPKEFDQNLPTMHRLSVKIANDHVPTTSSDWTDLEGVSAAPSTIDSALDTLVANLGTQSQYASGTITTGEILALNATPKVLIAAPGAGKTIIVEELQAFLDYNAATYVVGAGEDLTLQYTTGGVNIMTIDNDVTTFLAATADAHLICKPKIYDCEGVAGSEHGLLLLTVDNESVEMFLASGETATGDSPIKWAIRYRIVDSLT